MKYYITFILVALIICLSFMLATNYNKLNADTKIIINYSKYYAGTEPYILKR